MNSRLFPRAGILFRSCIALAICVAWIFSGCSPESLSSPSLTPSPQQSNALSDSRHLSGLYRVEITRPELRIEIAPNRIGMSHWNVTSFLSMASCDNCIAFSDAKLIEPDILSVDVSITHPISDEPSLDVYDVRGVVFGTPIMTFLSGTVSGILNNPDGFTARWQSEPWARINPYVAFATEDPERRFGSGSTHSSEILINLPESEPLVLDFAIDVCWLPSDKIIPGDPTASPHCNEAYDLQCDVSGPINAHENAVAAATVKFSDWQGDGASAYVTVEVPSIMPEAVAGELLKGSASSTTFVCALKNEIAAPPCEYPVLICVRDALNNESTDSLASFAIAQVEISPSAPPIKDIVIYPGKASLEDKGSKVQFTAFAVYEDGGLAELKSGVEWKIDGTDLNDSALAKIDSIGMVERLSSKWWGGTATVHASFGGFDAVATVFCVDPFADEASVAFGAFCSEGGPYTKPELMLGPPKGGGMLAGGTDVCALGYGGVATLEFVNNVIVDGPGPDFIVFENAFYSGGCMWNSAWQNVSWSETGIIEVSKDGDHWTRFPPDYNPLNVTCGIEPWANGSSFYNLAGVHPVIASVGPDGTLKDGVDPTDPLNAGGDLFDLSTIGIDWCRFVRIIDTGDSEDATGSEQYDSDGDLISDYGKHSALGAQPGQAGFDCDSVAAIHSVDPVSFDK